LEQYYFERSFKNYKMLTINDLKMDIISLVSNLNDYEELVLIKDRIQVINGHSKDFKVLPFEKGVTDVRSGLNADAIFAEQGEKAISYEDVKSITKDIKWEVSLNDMLDALD